MRLVIKTVWMGVLAVGILGGARGAFAAGVVDYLGKLAEWFGTEEAKGVAGNLLSHQSELGGWPKNEDTTAKVFTGDRKKIVATFDNGATTDELRFLARYFNATKDAESRAAFEKGCDYIVKAQYPTGGWPQYSPPPEKKYHRYITFNDDAMVRLLGFLREVSAGESYAFVDAARKKEAGAAFERGIACILKCQITVDGKLTGWCAQHDEKDLSPQAGRTYELASISGMETVGIVRLLMSLEKPSPEVVKSVQGAAAWLESVQIAGLRLVVTRDSKGAAKKREVVADANAPAVWARFYEIGTNRPLFCDRDGIAKYDLAEVGAERRNGYAWYGTWGQALLEKEYPAWKKRIDKE